MKVYKIALFSAAGLLFLSTLNALSFPGTLLTALQVVVPLLALYAAFLYRSKSLIVSLALLVAVFAFNPFMAPEFDHRTLLSITLAVAAAFIRIGLNLRKISIKESGSEV
jgi:hypothetical protein